MKDDRFYPCNEREARILRTLTGDKLEQYKQLRHDGKFLMEALRLTDFELYQIEDNKETKQCESKSQNLS